MVKLVLCALFALCLVLDIDCLTLDQCPPGYRCQKKTHRLRRAPDSPVPDELELEMCMPGTFSPGGADECTPCETGTYAPHPAAPGCYVCPSGYMCPRTDLEPEKCPPGSYNNLTRQTCCRSCPPGKFTFFEGMAQCYDCPVGQSCPKRTKLPCEEEDSACVPFWQMPSSDQGTTLTYKNANTRITGDMSRSVCASFRASPSNDNNIIFSIGSSDTTCDEGRGCNTHFTLAIRNATHIDILGMCHLHNNNAIRVEQNTLYDGSIHRICATYNNTDSNLCIYLDSKEPQCLIRTNSPYNTGLGDVRIGWWPDNNREFTASEGGLIRSVSLFDSVIPPRCVNYQRVANF